MCLRKYAVKSALFTSVLFSVYGVAFGADSSAPIRIGATMSETGAYATQGRAAKRGYELCEKHLNQQGGILGRPVQYVIHDDASRPGQAIALYESMIQSDEIELLMGPYGSTLTEAIAPVTEHHNKVLISPLAATTSIWEQGRDHLFMVLPPAEVFLAGLIDIANSQGYERIGLLSEQSLFPEAVRQGASELAHQFGMKVLINESYPSGMQDFSELAVKVKSEGIEVLGMAASSLDNFAAMVKAMEANDVEIKMFGTSGAVQEFYDQLGDAAENVFGLSAWEPEVPVSGASEFAEAFESEFGIAPSFHAAGGYGSCMMFAEAIEAAGTTDDSAIREALLTLKTTTIFGPFEVDQRGYQVANQGVFIQWQDGKKVIVWPANIAQEKPRFSD